MNIYLISRKIHRILVIVISVSILLMTFTGIILKYPRITNIIPLNLVSVRSLHNVASPLFSVFLVLMMITGLVLYLYPVWMRRKQPPVKSPEGQAL